MITIRTNPEIRFMYLRRTVSPNRARESSGAGCAGPNPAEGALLLYCVECAYTPKNRGVQARSTRAEACGGAQSGSRFRSMSIFPAHQAKGLTMEESGSYSRGAVAAAFLTAVVIGSGNFVAVSFSNEELPPFWGAGLRFSLAALIFLGIALALRLEWPRGKALALTSAYGVFTFTLSYALMYWALTQMSAGMAAVVLATVPLVTPLLATAQKLEPLNGRALVGALIAMAGILWMTIGSEGLIIPGGAIVATLAAAVTVGESVILGKRASANHPAMNNAVGMAVGAPLLLVVSLVAGESWNLPTEGDTIVAVGYLVTIGSVGLFVLTLLVVRLWTASATAYMFVLFPVGAMLLDAWLTGVPLTVRGITGALIVMGSVWFGAVAPGARKGRKARQPTPVG